jgi:hypothetical protein
MIKVMEKVYLVSPLYLGDAFVINALVHKWAQEAHEVHVPTLPQYVHTLQCLYADQANIRVVPYLGKEREAEYIQKYQLHVINFRTLYHMHKLPIKHHDAPVEVPVNWDRQIYEYFDVPFSHRYTQFRLPTHIPDTQKVFDELNPDHAPYVLWHGESDTQVHRTQIDLTAWRRHIGAPDRRIITIKPGVTVNLLSYMKLIEHAEEIHCIPSSMQCLVDSVWSRTQAQLFFHDVRATTIMQVNSRWNQNRWHVVYYDHKI